MPTEGKFDYKKTNIILHISFTIDSICEFITFGPVLQLNLKGSKQWMKIEDDVRDLCNIGSDVQIYSIGNLPVPVPVLDIGNEIN